MYAAKRRNHRAVMNVAHLQWVAIILATGVITTVASLSIAYGSGRLGWW